MKKIIFWFLFGYLGFGFAQDANETTNQQPTNNQQPTTNNRITITPEQRDEFADRIIDGLQDLRENQDQGMNEGTDIDNSFIIKQCGGGYDDC